MFGSLLGFFSVHMIVELWWFKGKRACIVSFYLTISLDHHVMADFLDLITVSSNLSDYVCCKSPLFHLITLC